MPEFPDNLESNYPVTARPLDDQISRSSYGSTGQQDPEQETPSIINDVISAWPGIVVGGGVFSFAVGILFIVITLARTGGLANTAPELIFGALFGLGAGFFIGMICTMMVCMLTIPLTFAFDGSFNGILDSRSAVSICGGLTGHIPTCYLWLSVIFAGAPIWAGFISTFAVLVGHIGAVYSASKDVRLSEEWTYDCARRRPRYQLKVWHMFVLTGWFAAIFAIESFFANYYFIIVVGIWMVTQGIIIALDRIWLRKWQKGQLKRKLQREVNYQASR